MHEVAWADTAIDGLAELCLHYADHWAEINSAVDIIEYRLRRSPMEHSRLISEGLWRIDITPIAICFTISPSDLTIESIGWIG